MGPRKTAALVAAGILLITACSGTTSDEAAETQDAVSSAPEITLEAPTVNEDDPMTGLDVCQDEVLETVVNPDTVTFGDGASPTKMETSSGTGTIYSLTGFAESVNKQDETVEYEWNCMMLWHDEAWSASYAEVDLEPSVVKHRDQRPSTGRDVCEAAVKSQLVSPRSAEFTHARDGIDESGPDDYVLYGLVESQNRAGVWLESNWICGVNWDAASHSWDVGRTTIR